MTTPTVRMTVGEVKPAQQRGARGAAAAGALHNYALCVLNFASSAAIGKAPMT